MLRVISILQRVLVNYFYKVNSGLFLFAFFVLFGAPSQPLRFHMSLITGIIKSEQFLLLVMLLWLLYNFKCINYIIKQLRNQQQNFLFNINNLSPVKVYLFMLYVHVQVYMPVLVYSCVVAFIAFKNHIYVYPVEIIVFNLVVMCFSAYIYYLEVGKRKFVRYPWVLPALRLRLPTPFFLYQLTFIWKERKQMLFMSKLFSLALLYGFIKLYEPDHYDVRPLQLCLLVVAATQTAIVFQVREFEETYLVFTKNLPLTNAGRFIRMILMYIVLMLPEFILMFQGVPLHFKMIDLPQLILMPVALLCIFHTSLYLEDTNMEQFMRIVFGILAGCFFILLYNPGLVLPILILLLAFALYHSYYYQFEKKYN